jgi:hypothetical protein
MKKVQKTKQIFLSTYSSSFKSNLNKNLIINYKNLVFALLSYQGLGWVKSSATNLSCIVFVSFIVSKLMILLCRQYFILLRFQVKSYVLQGCLGRCGTGSSHTAPSSASPRQRTAAKNHSKDKQVPRSTKVQLHRWPEAESTQNKLTVEH